MKKKTAALIKGHKIRARRTELKRARLLRSPDERLSNRHRKVKTVTLYSPGKITPAISFRPATPMPARMCMMENPEQTVLTMETIRSFLRRQPVVYRVPRAHRSKYIFGYQDFAEVVHITTPAALVLLAEYQRRLMVHGAHPKFVNLHSWNPNVLEKLCRIGFFSVLGYQDHMIPRRGTENPDLKVMRFIKGSSTDELEQIGGQLRSLIDFIDPTVQIGDVVRKSLVTAIGEAIANVTMHAYTDDHNFIHQHVGSFWFAGAADLKKRQLSVSMFDQGHTIPKTYDIAKWDKKAVSFIRNFDANDRHDAIYIEAAVKYGASKTNENHRGNGLPQICNVIENCPGGKIMVCSRSGIYCSGAGTQPHTQVLNGSIGGTLISWEVNF